MENKEKTYISTNLKYLRSTNNKSLNDVASICNKTDVAVHYWENGTREPNAVDIAKLSNFYNITVDDLLLKDLRFDNAELVDISSDTVQIPVLGRIPAGMPFEAIEDTYTIDYEEIPKEWLKGGKEYFALKLDGDSMEPEYHNNDIVIFLKSKDCESGQDCCIKINGFDATFKRIKKQENGIMIIPLNENNSTGFSSTFYTKEEIESKPIEIVGVVKQIRRNI